MNPTLRRAEKLLIVAAAYAVDGAALTAIARTVKALLLLEKEKRRRVKIGLLPKDTEEKRK